jgi:RNA polymerase sigma factor (sigma-70 family)
VNTSSPICVPPQITQLQAHDPQAWSWCVSEFGTAVRRYARSAGHRDPCEVVGAVFETLARRIDDFDGDMTQLRSFIFTVAHARIVDDYRRRHRHYRAEPTDPDDLQQIEQGRSTTLRTGHASSDGSGIVSGRVLNAIAELAPFQREVIELRYLRGLSVEEVAHLTQRSHGAVRTATSRGLHQLRVQLLGSQSSASLVSSEIAPFDLS